MNLTREYGILKAVRDELDPNLMQAPTESGEGQRYRILQCIGVGPRSDSFLCEDQFQAGKQVIRRNFHEDLSSENKDLIDLVMAPWAELSHPNLALIEDMGIEEGRAFLVRERVPGVPITEALAGASRPQALSLIGQLCLALDYLFAHNVLHLNLKPENLLVDRDVNPWRLKVLDYGISPVLYPPTKIESNAVGTPPFTAPEYAIRRTFDVRSDLYSVGVYLFMALAGKMPFNAKDSVGMLQAQLKSDPPSLSSISPKLNALVQRLLSRDPQSRYGTPRQAWAALCEAADDPQLSHRVYAPEIFSDPDDVFRYQEYLKLFRRIALQGGRWAITGESGQGKSFLARWLERLFWLNQKPVLRIPGRDIAMLEGEHSLNPAEPTYLLIDDADQGPAEAWLRARPYAHIVAFVPDKSWTQKKPGWQVYPLKPLDAKQMAGILERDISLAGDRMTQEWLNRTHGEPGSIVRLARSLVNEEIVKPAGLHFKLDAERFLSLPKSSSSDPAEHWDETSRRVLTYLSFVQVPVRADVLAAWMQLDVEAVRPALLKMVSGEWARRRVAFGQEFFSSLAEFNASSKARLRDADAKFLLSELERLEWKSAAFAAAEIYYPATTKSEPSTIVLKARLAAGAGRHDWVLKQVDANFVNALSSELKAQSFEALGRSLLESGKHKQSDAALKNAYKGYQALADHDGMARVLLDLGRTYHEMRDTERALRFYQQAITEAEHSKERDALEGKADLLVGNLYAAATDFENAESRYLTALQKLGYASQEASIAKVYADYAGMALQMGDDARAEALALEGLRRAIFTRSDTVQGSLFAILAKLQEQRGDLRGAAERFAEAIDRYSQSSQALARLGALLERALFYERNRELILASQDAQEALREAKRQQQTQLEGKALLVLGKVQRRDVNRLNEAIQQLDAAYQKLAEVKDVRLAWECLFEKGEIERYRENRPIATAYYRQALQLLDHALTQLVPGTAEHRDMHQRRNQVQTILESLS